MTNVSFTTPCTAFVGNQFLTSGPLHVVAFEVKKATEWDGEEPVLIFDDSTGRVIDLDLRGSAEDVVGRLAGPVTLEPERSVPEESAEEEKPRGRGRPKLGVVPREVTLLPRHWDWLSAQPGGASVALRKLVEEARRRNGDAERRRSAQAAAFHFMSAMAGNLPGFEEAIRALFRDDRRSFGEIVAIWPPDIRDHAIRLAFADLEPAAVGDVSRPRINADKR